MTTTQPADVRGQPFERHPALASWIERLANTPCGLSLGEWMTFVETLNAALNDAARASHPAPAVGGEVGGLDLAALEKVARAATQGPWTNTEARSTGSKRPMPDFHEARVHAGSPTNYGNTIAVVCMGGAAATSCAKPDVDANTAHIATFDPPTVLRLLAELQRLAAEVEETGENLRELSAIAVRTASERDAAEARATKAEEERDGWKRVAEERFEAMRNAHDLAYATRYLFDPDFLDRMAEKIDCGGECDSAWREHDTNATGCTKSESEDGCPFEDAATLRDISKAIRLQAWSLAFEPPRLATLTAQLTEARSQVERLREAAARGRRAVLELARVRGALEEGLSKAGILRTESVYVWASQAREFIATAKRLEEEDLAALNAEAGGEKTTGQENDNG